MTLTTQLIDLPAEADTVAFAVAVAGILRAGDTLLLDGPVGAGKTTFARALIRARLQAPHEDVPSPTYTLIQTYPHPSGDIWHADLYRLSHPDEAVELGLDEAFETAICLIEWPDRLGAHTPGHALRIALMATERGRSATLTGPGAWARRLATIVGRLTDA